MQVRLLCLRPVRFYLVKKSVLGAVLPDQPFHIDHPRIMDKATLALTSVLAIVNCPSTLMENFDPGTNLVDVTLIRKRSENDHRRRGEVVEDHRRAPEFSHR